MSQPANSTPPTIVRLGVAPRFPKVANYLKSYKLGMWEAKWSIDLIPALEAYGRGDAGHTLRPDGKVTQQFSDAAENLHRCAGALRWHAVQAALGNKKPQARGKAKPVTTAATRREFQRLIKNGKHLHSQIWPQNMEQYFDPTNDNYVPKFAAELDAEVSEGEYKIVRHLQHVGHAPETLEACLLEFGPALVLRKGDKAQPYAAETVARVANDEEFKRWATTVKAEQTNAEDVAASGTPWLDFWRRSVAYNYVWLRMARGGDHVWLMDVVDTAAFCLVLGWNERAMTLFHHYAERLHSKGFTDFDKKRKKPYFQRRTQFFLLRLIADWQGIAGPPMPPQADDEPLFTALLAHWRTPDADAIAPLLLAACDRHTHLVMIGKDSPDFHTWGDLTYIPFEILAVLRLRQTLGLSNPQLDHPLMATPLGSLPPIAEPYSDELLDAVLARARAELADV
ncbi:MAG TPA: hypothetical protein VFB32_13090 [Rudaea sp.]|nr:hypothetical protein [Rudaea sp.]